jgi:N-acetylneuraminate synthase
MIIGGRQIGSDQPPYVVAELSGNHNGEIDRAFRLIDAAKEAGADAVKLQTYTADTITIDSDRPEFRVEGGLWDGRTLYDLYKEAHTPWEWHGALFAHARKAGITCFSSPFDPTAVDLLESLGATAYKIASFEIVDLPLVAYVARRGKPMVMSTGMANLGEIEEAVHTARKNGCNDIVLLHCVSAYPAPIQDSNIRMVPHLGETFSCISGLSDHTPGCAAAVASVALGGCFVEKHLTLSRTDGGIDAAFSLEPPEFKTLVHDCKNAWASLGSISYDVAGSERTSLAYRRSLYVVEEIPAGALLTPFNIRSIRPGLGLPPKALSAVLGCRAARDLKRGEPLAWSCVSR